LDVLLSQQNNNDATLPLLSDDEISTFPFGDLVQSAKFPRGFSFAPSGLDFVWSRTHGLRRGLCSCAAPRLVYCGCDNNRGMHFSGASLLTAGFVLRRVVIAIAPCP
jgi:hypothetical protein